MAEDLIRLKPEGLVGPGELFHIDAWSRAPVNLVTHAHSDHAREGSGEYAEHSCTASPATSSGLIGTHQTSPTLGDPIEPVNP